MGQINPEFERLNEWEDIAKKLVEKYPERYGHVDLNKVIAYVITNKELTDVSRPYEMQTDRLPMRLTSPYDYFIWFKHSELWYDKPHNIKVALVASALERVDPEKPFAIGALDYRDQNVMIHTFGPSWSMNANIPDALESDLIFRD